jgi:hypothetical protein
MMRFPVSSQLYYAASYKLANGNIQLANCFVPAANSKYSVKIELTRH